MRETNNLKRFRAWVQDSNKSPFCMVKVSTLTWDIGRIGYIVNENFCIPPEHLMQSTGLHDKNGKEIFEGDIVRFQTIKGDVRFVDGCFFVMRDVTCPSNATIEEGEPLTNQYQILGNLYQSPELLEEKP